MAGTIREQSSSAKEQSVRLIYRVFNCDRLLEPPPAPWAWHGDKLTIGRGEKSALQAGHFTIDDGRVSGQHASLEVKAGSLWLNDLGSSNGTWLNGEAVKAPVEVHPGDLIEVGRTLLTWREVATGLAARVVPEGCAFANLRTFSPAFAEVLTLAARAAPTKEPVLLVGETGTGKDVLAHALHEKSGRKGPFVAIDSGAIPETLFESTLFGHERGAFTGATEPRIGEIVRAHKGTLFLDEVGNLSASSQARLLRVLETRHVTALGAKEGQTVDVRVIAATNRAVLETEEEFREDLVHRLAGFVLSPPPLRDRREDLGLLLKALLEDAGVKTASMSPQAARALFLDPLRGNVRGLRNVLRRAAVGHEKVHLEKLDGLGSGGDDRPSAKVKKKAAGAASRPRGWVPSREELEQVLKKNDGSVAAAARELESYPRQLYRWMEELGMNPDDYR